METKYNLKLGADFLRDCVSWLDSRDECLNQGKTHNQLINEFYKEVCPDPNWYNY
jgi:hypothetical protein